MKYLLQFTIIASVVACQSNPQPAAPTLTAEKEAHRPQWHFSPDSMWMNDPNGMVYFEGEYHLFYQYYPDSTVWGPMHWGHAVSEDLIHWQHLPVALYPDSLGYIFSGSAVVDWNNTSGFGTTENPPLVAVYTYHDPVGEKAGTNDFQTQGIAYSRDKGRTWIKHAGNPVIPNPGIRDFRDPKVFWHSETEKWIMIFAAADHVKLYNSADLKSWQLISEFGVDQGSHGGVWECPDLFTLTDQEGQTTWVMIVSLGDGAPNGGSGTQYFLGDFDGKNFTNQNPSDEILWMDYGRDNYAGVTWSDIPKEDGRRIFIGWMSNWKYAQVVPTKKWRSAMTMARSLGLQQTEAGLRLITKPVVELSRIAQSTTDYPTQTLSSGHSLALDSLFSQGLLQLEIVFEKPTAGQLQINLSNALGEQFVTGYQAEADQFFMDRSSAGKLEFSDNFAGVHYAPRMSTTNLISVTLLMDVASVEMFADDGQVVMTDIMFPNEDFSRLAIETTDTDINIVELKATPLKPFK